MKQIIILTALLVINSFAQHLPLKIGNQWYYRGGQVPPSVTNISTAVDTVTINNKLYYKIERRNINTNEIIRITYDRIEGDSLYFRMENGNEYLVFNFAWQDSQVIVSPSFLDSGCFDIKIIERDTITIWGIQTEYYTPTEGRFCPENGPDTTWYISLSWKLLYSNYFGCLNGTEGELTGAVIDNIVYGDFLPVELLTFSKKILLNSVELKWSTATETNNYGFEILRNNSRIGYVKGNGTTTQINDYEYLDNNLFAGKYKYELIQIDYDGTKNKIAETEASINIPNIFTLSQNYPNPFNPTTTISFQIPKESYVYIKVFDCLGKEIKTLVNETKKEGSYTVKFDALELADGIYFYQMSAENFISTKKMLLIK